jgi:hypothetical protein
MKRVDSLWLSAQDRRTMVILLRCAADMLLTGRVTTGNSTTSVQWHLECKVGIQLVAYKLMKHAASVWKNLDLANSDNVRHLGMERVLDVHVWSALFAAQRIEEGDWP